MDGTEEAASQRSTSSSAPERKGRWEQGVLDARRDNWVEDFNSLFDQSGPNFSQLSLGSGLP